MEQTTEAFFHDFRQGLMAGAEANNSFQLSEFMDAVTNELIETGFIEGFEHCYFRPPRGMRVDGYWFNDEQESLDLFVSDFDCRAELASLTRTEVEATFKRVVNFFTASIDNMLYLDLEDTSPEYDLSRQIYDRRAGNLIRKINFFLISERGLSERLQTIEENNVCGIPATYQIWDISRLQRQRSSHGHKEVLDLNFHEILGRGLSCLSAHLGSDAHQSYLVVMPAEGLSDLYEKYGARLLEQNVRCFLQARSKVNKGIRSTILNEPDMFFAYNNGITATAQEVETEMTEKGQEIIRIKDLQIVNGGQTTASLFHTRRKDKASLKKIFVPMKLSVIDSEAGETIVPRISEYANTQNRVNAADFFSNHPFHIRMENFSRRIWAPPQQGAQRETLWFYERARGQYGDAQSKMTPAERRRFKAEKPKPQMFTKTDLAKFENVWDDHPRWVNLGAQKNFARYAGRIGKEWAKSPDSFNELYYKRMISRAIIFRKTERLVPKQPWYNGGYRANIVSYAIASINECCRRRRQSINHKMIWDTQSLSSALSDSLAIAAKFVNDDIIYPPQGISNISEWAKKEGCWLRIQGRMVDLERLLPDEFRDELVTVEDRIVEEKSAKKTQKIDDGIEAQKLIFKIPIEKWTLVLKEGTKKNMLSAKEIGILKVAEQIPNKIPSDKQCLVLVDVLQKAKLEGIFQ